MRTTFSIPPLALSPPLRFFYFSNNYILRLIDFVGNHWNSIFRERGAREKSSILD